MKTAGALISKYVFTLACAAIAFRRISAVDRWPWILAVALVGAIACYLLGDLRILPRYGNTTAAIYDGVLAAAIAYVVASLVPTIKVTHLSLLIFALLVALVEYFFHICLLRSEKVAP
jgi:uncharacterized membrane protein YcaP (DUF421 family)